MTNEPEPTDRPTPGRCETCRWAAPAEFPARDGTAWFVCQARLPPMLRHAAKMQQNYVRSDDLCVLHA